MFEIARSVLLAGTAMLAMACPLPAAAQAAPAPPPGALAGFTLSDTQVFDMTAADDGQVYRIFVSAPSQPAPAGGFPVLYILDGNALFSGFAGERRIEEFAKEGGGSMIVVGVGYPTDQAYDQQRRRYDLTSRWTAKLPEGQALMRTGGNEHFAHFLLDQLRPEIARRYKVAATRQSLFGHSLGGLFALHMLYTRPDAFEAIIAASPSIWWSDKAILEEERTFVDTLSSGKLGGRPISRLMLFAGARDAMTITPDAEALLARLAPLPVHGLYARYEKLEDETHVSVPYRAITPSFRFAIGAP